MCGGFMYKSTLILIFELTALAASAIYRVTLSANAADGFHVVTALVLCCLFFADFLTAEISRKKKKSPSGVPRLFLTGAGFLVVLFCGGSDYFPVLVPLLFALTDLLRAREYFYGIFTVGTILAALILKPSAYVLIVSGILFVTLVFSGTLTERLERVQIAVEEEKRAVTSLHKKNADLKAYSRTLRETAALEERSRFSARIHDRLGHGISGSILLLEGAQRCMKTDPERAEKCLGTAVENLRGSVDSIREALREERPPRHIAGITELRETLERFSVQHEIGTDFTVEGETEKIPPQVWNCLKENLIEATANTVRHSEADLFSFRLFIYNKVVKAEFSDNGKSGGNFKKGMGLEAMEERTADCGGSCVFQKSGAGFRIVNVFRL